MHEHPEPPKPAPAAAKPAADPMKAAVTDALRAACLSRSQLAGRADAVQSGGLIIDFYGHAQRYGMVPIGEQLEGGEGPGELWVPSQPAEWLEGAPPGESIHAAGVVEWPARADVETFELTDEERAQTLERHRNWPTDPKLRADRLP